MPDETAQPTPATPTDTAPTTTPEAPTSGASSFTGTTPVKGKAAAEGEAGAAASADWRTIVDQVPKDEWTKHHRVAGTAGEIAQRMLAQHRQQWEAERQAEDARKAADQAAEAVRAERERLRQLRREDPVAYAEEMESRDLREAEAEAAAARQNELRQQIDQRVQGFARSVAGALQTLPEWQPSDADLKRLAQVMAGKQNDDEVIAAFNAEALTIIAEKRANARMTTWREKELAKEREAIRTEEAAKLLQQGGSPDLARPKGTALRTSPDATDYRAYNEWYEKEVLNRTR